MVIGMPTITPNLWFNDNNAVEAAEFYVSVFPNSRITQIVNYTEAGPGPAGEPVVVEFELDGQPYVGINGGDAGWNFNLAVSLMINADGQDEVDHYWNALTADGGQEMQCGWLTDKYGVAWQVWPVQANELISSSDTDVAVRATQAMFTMQKIDLAEMQAAAAGQPVAS